MQTCSSVALYDGYKSDIIAVLGNLAYRRPAVQGIMAKQGALELLLSSTKFDPDAAIVREWALWAVKNMCDNNPEVQAEIGKLKIDTVVVDEALSRQGMGVELDRATGKLKMTGNGPAVKLAGNLEARNATSMGLGLDSPQNGSCGADQIPE